ncbi:MULTISPECIES: hypothetical protein [Emticicia]|uniref:hypothetical protein n=1 Tax=Emticicia TaxID=312278 RepID=UPI0020A129B9|nr:MULTISPECIES: hypothetical protein [Emticicia]UTA68500.1 hypothetical protein MB380_01530 [Emticicia sp. 21SJ11W-3]
MQQTKEPPFNKKTLLKIPVFYRCMTVYKTEEVGELKVTARFGTSKRHFSKNYLNYSGHKPVSELNLFDL